jgi:hypothetical protein
MVERGDKIVAGPIPDLTIYTVEGIINENVVAGSTISTDTGASLFANIEKLPNRAARYAMIIGEHADHEYILAHLDLEFSDDFWRQK